MASPLFSSRRSWLWATAQHAPKINKNNTFCLSFTKFLEFRGVPDATGPCGAVRAGETAATKTMIAGWRGVARYRLPGLGRNFSEAKANFADPIERPSTLAYHD